MTSWINGSDWGKSETCHVDTWAALWWHPQGEDPAMWPGHLGSDPPAPFKPLHLPAEAPNVTEQRGHQPWALSEWLPHGAHEIIVLKTKFCDLLCSIAQAYLRAKYSSSWQGWSDSATGTVSEAAGSESTSADLQSWLPFCHTPPDACTCSV